MLEEKYETIKMQVRIPKLNNLDQREDIKRKCNQEEGRGLKRTSLEEK